MRGYAVMANNDTDALFHNAHAALSFCFNFSGQYQRPAMNHAAAPARGLGKGLSGMDGAAQAGIINSELKKLDFLKQAILTARVAPRSMRCECRRLCCSGKMANTDWVRAIDTITDKTKELLNGSHTDYAMRCALVKRVYDDHSTLDQIAERFDVHRNTAGAHYGHIHRWLLGQKATNISPAVEGIETVAWMQIETILRNAKIVGG